ncbi:hypothetical protein BH23GEM4_BH23GEM4_18440 [soil metagenome]
MAFRVAKQEACSGGMGSAGRWRAVLGDGTEARERLARCYREWPFFRATVDSAQREMARARLPVAREYDRLAAGDDPDGSRFHELIEENYERARRGILAITGHEELLENDPVIRRSIQLRNPYTDVLNLLQLELLRRARRGGDDETLRQALFLSINGIAAAMQSTGVKDSASALLRAREVRQDGLHAELPDPIIGRGDSGE